MKKLIVIILAGALIWAGVNFIIQRKKKRKEKKTSGVTKTEVLPQVGFKAPNITLKGLDGKLYSLHDAKGKPYLINFGHHGVVHGAHRSKIETSVVILLPGLKSRIRFRELLR